MLSAMLRYRSPFRPPPPFWKEHHGQTADRPPWASPRNGREKILNATGERSQQRRHSQDMHITEFVSQGTKENGTKLRVSADSHGEEEEPFLLSTLRNKPAHRHRDKKNEEENYVRQEKTTIDRSMQSHLRVPHRPHLHRERPRRR